MALKMTIVTADGIEITDAYFKPVGVVVDWELRFAVVSFKAWKDEASYLAGKAPLNVEPITYEVPEHVRAKQAWPAYGAYNVPGIVLARELDPTEDASYLDGLETWAAGTDFFTGAKTAESVVKSDSVVKNTANKTII